MLKFSKKEIFKLNKSLKLENLFNDIADAWVKSYKEGITKTSTDINGNRFAPLSPNTIADKKRRGSKAPTKPLLDKGKMKEVYVKKRATKASKQAQIFINKQFREIPSIVHNEGTAPYKIIPKKAKLLRFYTASGWVNTKEVNHTGQKQREWYGIGDVQKAIASKIANKQIDKALM